MLRILTAARLSARSDMLFWRLSWGNKASDLAEELLRKLLEFCDKMKGASGGLQVELVKNLQLNEGLLKVELSEEQG